METDNQSEGQGGWITLACPSCSKKIKLPAEKAATSKFKCPACGEIVSLKKAGEEKASLPPIDPNAELISQANPVVAEEEEEDTAVNERFLGNLKQASEGLHLKDADVGGEVVEKDGALVIRRRRKIKKRKQKEEKLDWEADAEVEEKLKEDDDEWSYAVDAEVAEDGSVIEHRRRIRKKKNTTLYEKFAARMSTAFWVFSVATGVILGGAAIWIGVKGGETKGAGKTVTETRDLGVITDEITEEAFAAVQRYLACESWAERVPLVRTPNKVREHMETYYQENPFEKVEDPILLDEFGTKLAKRDQIYRPDYEDQIDIVTLAVGYPNGEGRIFALERREILGTDNKYEYLIDWEVSEHFEQIPYDVFRDSGQPGDKAEFRVQLRGRVSYHIEPFDESQVWHGFELTYPTDPDFKLFGYVRKDSPVYKELTELFLYGEHPIPMVEVKYPDTVIDRGAVEITRMLQSTWYARE